MRRRALAVAAVAAVTLALAGGWFPAAPPAAGEVTTHVYDGRDVEDGEYPQVAFIFDNAGAVYCTGTLVAPSWVLTAAHCVERDPGALTVTVGAATLAEREGAEPGAHHRGVTGIEVHPDYPGTVSEPPSVADFVADLALLELDAPVDDITPARLASEAPEPGNDGEVVGWGITGPEQTVPERLQAARLPVLAPELCQELFADPLGNADEFDPDRMLCAGEPYVASPQTCEGDSGGPLFQPGTDEILGVTSFGSPGCGDVGVGGFTLAAPFSDWVFVHTADPAVAPERLAGPERVATAIEVAQAWEPADTDTVVVATARDFPDALAAGAYATARGAPLLLTEPDVLPEAVAGEISRLAVDEAVVLGGEAAVAATVVESLEEIIPDVERIAGDDRYATAAELSLAAGAPAGEALVASGEVFADAVSAGTLLGLDAPPPLLLTRAEEVPEATLEALEALAVDEVAVIGGETVVGDDVVAVLEEVGADVRRVAGEDRYDTSAAVLDEALERHAEPRGLALVAATGQDYPDALTAGVLAGHLGGVLSLVPPSGPPEVTAETLGTGTWARLLVVGGFAAIDELTAVRLALELPSSH